MRADRASDGLHRRESAIFNPLDPLPARVEIASATLAAIDAHAREAAPRECCGLLVGRQRPVDHAEEDAGATGSAPALAMVMAIARAVPTRNVAPEATRYLIDPADHFRLLREMRQTRETPHTGESYEIKEAREIHETREVRETGEVRETRGAHSTRDASFGIVGAYHSHPGSPPVPSPTDLADALAHFLYVIASPRRDGPGSDTRAWWLVDGNFREIPLVPVP